MKERELYLDKIRISDVYSIQIDPDNEANLLVFENDTIVEVFSLTRRIYTLFKILQELTKSDDYIQYNKRSKLYAKEIHIKDDVYMRLTEAHETTSVDFYTKEDNGNEEILYITKVTYMTQKLFNKMLIPFEVKNDPDYQENNPSLFKDMIDILQMIKI